MSKFIVKIREKTLNTHEYLEGTDGFNRTFIADTLPDACEYLANNGEGADNRFFDYTIEEVEEV